MVMPQHYHSNGLHVNAPVTVWWRSSRYTPVDHTASYPPHYRPTIASTSAFKKRSTTSMKPIDGISSSKAVIDAI
jgi:hypothetical protein